MRIEDYAEQSPPPWPPAAIGEQWIVGNHGANADQNRVMLMTEFVRVSAGGFAGDPVGTS